MWKYATSRTTDIFLMIKKTVLVLCVCVRGRAWTQMHAHICLCRPNNSNVVLQKLSSLVFEIGFPTRTWGLLIRLNWLTIKPKNSPVSTSPEQDYKHTACSPAFLHGCWGYNSDPHVCTSKHFTNWSSTQAPTMYLVNQLLQVDNGQM